MAVDGADLSRDADSSQDVGSHQRSLSLISAFAVGPEAVQKGLQAVRAVIDERGRKRRQPARETDGQMARVLPTLELTGMGHAELAIEVVVEDLDIKRRVFAELEVRVPETALLASNTSSLSINAIAQGLLHPERFVG